MTPETEQQYKNQISQLKAEIEKLKQEKTLNIKREKYGLNWIDVPEAFDSESENKIPILEEVKEKAIKNDDGKPTHILIEGDNYHALTCLNYTHAGKIDVIYIDPPYNTGKEFVYCDGRFLKEYPNGKLIDKENPLKHSSWLSFMNKRLKLAKNLLSETGTIFISIDDNEQTNLKLLCDEIFGEKNFIANIIWKRKRGRDNSAKWFSKAHEYCLLYAKNKDNVQVNYLDLDTETKKAYKNPDNDERGNYRMLGCWARGTQGGVKYDFTSKNGQYFSERLWLFSKENLTKLDNDDKLIIRGDNIYRKMFLYENKGKIPETLWDDVSNAANASDEIKDLFNEIVFDTPKPIPYIKRIIGITEKNKNSTILDFFAGSGTTLHATMNLNEEDGGHRQCILVQAPEKTYDEKDGVELPKKGSENAYNSGYKKISDITYERNRRVMEGYTNSKGESIPGLGNSLKYYKTSFVGKNNPANATDGDRITLAQKAGCLISLTENTLEEIETTDFYQIYTDGKRYTGIYFSIDTIELPQFVEKIESKKAPTSVYIFTWGSPEIFENEFDDMTNITIKSIPQPILEIYKSLNGDN